MSRGKLIAIEGIDGSGKTTIAKKLVHRLIEMNIDAHYTTEPTSSSIGRIIREDIILADRRPSPILEALLFAADRIWHVENVIAPAILSGVWIVCDRYVHSSIAYQGARGASTDWIREINRFILKPDWAFYIDVDPETGLRRKGVIESVTFENIAYLRKVREIYLYLVNAGELIYVDGMKAPDVIVEDIISILKSSI